MELAQLRYAVAIADEGGFTRAAEVLGIAQPSLSQSIKRLESELGVALFNRRGRTVDLTDAGTDFLGPARVVLRDVESLNATISRHVALVTGVLDIGALPNLAVHPMATLIGEFRSRYPGVMIRIADSQLPSRLLDMVVDGRCELAIVNAVGQRSGVTSTIIGEQEFHVVLAPHEPHGGEAMTLAELATRPLILGPSGTAVREQLVEALVADGHTPHIAVEIPQRDAIIPLVLRGAGCTVLPHRTARAAEEAGAVVRPLSPPLKRLVAIAHRDRQLSPPAQAFLEFAKTRSAMDAPTA